MRALMRCRRLPFAWVQDFQARAALMARVKAPVIPLLEYPDGSPSHSATFPFAGAIPRVRIRVDTRDPSPLETMRFLNATALRI
jgi:hypothetical protein